MYTYIVLPRLSRFTYLILTLKYSVYEYVFMHFILYRFQDFKIQRDKQTRMP